MRFATLGLALLAVVLPLSAQQFDDSITVNVVEVPVFVERFGVPVRGLTRDDFELFVNGKPQEIEYFDVIEESGAKEAGTADAARDAAPAPAELKRRRLFVLLFDIGGSSARSLHMARLNAMKYLTESDSGDAYAVATIGRGGVRFVVPFTTDRIAIQRAIGTLAPSDAADPFHLATLDVERVVWQEALGGTEATLEGRELGGDESVLFGGLSAALTDPFKARRIQPTMMESLQNEERLHDEIRLLKSLGDLADRLAPVSGVKHVVMLTERDELGELARLNRVVRMHERYREAGVVLDAVDIRVPFVPGLDVSSSSPTHSASLLPPDFLYTLSLGTGGTVASSLRNLQKSNGLTYVLAFRASPAAKKNNAIRVRVKNRAMFTDVRYRRSYATGKQATKDDSLFLADTLLNDIPQRGITLDLDVNETWIAAKIPGAELLAQPSAKPLTLDVFLYVFDEKGQAVAWNQLRLDVDLVAGRDYLSANPYTIRKEFNLEPGRYSAKALVRIGGTEMTGFRRTDFVVQAR